MKQQREMKLNPSQKGYQYIQEYSYLILGSLIVALAFNLFLNPNGIAPGGVSGLSTIIERQFGIEPAITQWSLNIPLFIAGLFLLGKKFGAKTAFGSIILPFFVLITKNLKPITHFPLLAAVYGGVVLGIGLGFVFRGKASTGGTDLAAQILHKYTGISLGFAVLLMDGLVVFTSGIVFGPENALYALISLFLTSKTIDFVQIGLAYSKLAFIISEQQEQIGQVILHDLDRGATILNGKGAYTGNRRDVLMVVFDQRETTRLKELIKSVDSNAFVIVTDTHEVLGEGFRAH
ncbi:YitT family protein [Tepidibacillus fermentans]|uniref:Uncharacterized membrane-anchored protein YitT (DUF2179 family) n=1 Tax=Tepidibacillus fermentans TaxID=1281767 RepID=A0A4R3KIQ4_9BACI|nr:YitT family protein [Tepidibacillus fermentans]TCS83292.1 uncharacterized membrane-anchored protein YitT (DUF2179 family) [Tepidibacillus fermentans]